MARRVACGVVDDPVGVHVLAGEQGRPAGRAEWRRRERVEEPRALAREPVDGRRLDKRMAGEAEVVPAQVVDENDDEFGRASVRGQVARRKTKDRLRRRKGWPVDDGTSPPPANRQPPACWGADLRDGGCRT